jgi:hypothetical protein
MLWFVMSAYTSYATTTCHTLYLHTIDAQQLCVRLRRLMKSANFYDTQNTVLTCLLLSEGRKLHASSQPISDGPYTRFRPSRSPFWVWTVDSFGGRYLGWWWWSTATTAGGRPECGSRGVLPNQGCVNAQAKTDACSHPLLSAFWLLSLRLSRCLKYTDMQLLDLDDVLLSLNMLQKRCKEVIIRRRLCISHLVHT